jgi:uncharacterized OB-fold protein
MRCGASDLAWTPVSGRARLFTWTFVHRAFLDDFADRVPNLTALVELDEDPSLRLAAQLVDVAREEHRVGLDLVVDPLEEQRDRAADPVRRRGDGPGRR